MPIPLEGMMKSSTALLALVPMLAIASCATTQMGGSAATSRYQAVVIDTPSGWSLEIKPDGSAVLKFEVDGFGHSRLQPIESYPPSTFDYSNVLSALLAAIKEPAPRKPVIGGFIVTTFDHAFTLVFWGTALSDSFSAPSHDSATVLGILNHARAAAKSPGSLGEWWDARPPGAL